jgi:GNAT superfamily N-acetyltransferase
MGLFPTYLPSFFASPSERVVLAYTEQGIEGYAADLGVTLELLPLTSSGVWVQNVEAKMPGRGAGTRILRALGHLADEHGVTLLLYAKPFGEDAMTLDTLVAFYRKVGFQPDDGVVSPHPEYDFGGCPMRRPPNPASA